MIVERCRILKPQVVGEIDETRFDPFHTNEQGMPQ